MTENGTEGPASGDYSKSEGVEDNGIADLEKQSFMAHQGLVRGHMVEKKNVFISHVHEDDALLPKLKELIAKAGMEVRDGSITSDKPNDAKNQEYIKREILAPRIQWASTLVVLIGHDTYDSWWVNWEIKNAVEQGKTVVGVYAQGATEADIPEELRLCGDAVIVGWQGERVVDAINGQIREWDKPDSGEARNPEWAVTRYSC